MCGICALWVLLINMQQLAVSGHANLLGIPASNRSGVLCAEASAGALRLTLCHTRATSVNLLTADNDEVVQ
jgi:hypothetical protein